MPFQLWYFIQSVKRAHRTLRVVFHDFPEPFCAYFPGLSRSTQSSKSYALESN